MQKEEVIMIKTLEFGTLPIATKTTWLTSDIISDECIQDCNGTQYEIRKTLNGALVALRV
jgi:hypothetical protein